MNRKVLLLDESHNCDILLYFFSLKHYQAISRSRYISTFVEKKNPGVRSPECFVATSVESVMLMSVF